MIVSTNTTHIKYNLKIAKQYINFNISVNNNNKNIYFLNVFMSWIAYLRVTFSLPSSDFYNII